MNTAQPKPNDKRVQSRICKEYKKREKGRTDDFDLNTQTVKMLTLEYDYCRSPKHADATHWLDGGLKLVVEELQTVVEDVLIGGVQTGLDAIPHHVGSSGRTLQL